MSKLDNVQVGQCPSQTMSKLKIFCGQGVIQTMSKLDNVQVKKFLGGVATQTVSKLDNVQVEHFL